MTNFKKRVFLDLDNTLYDTGALMALVQKDMESLGVPREEILRAQTHLNTSGYSFERHLRLLGCSAKVITERSKRYRAILKDGDRFLFPGVREGMRRLHLMAECHLLTFGLPRYQRYKMRGIASFRGMFTAQHYVWRSPTKGDVIRSYQDGRETYFVDDTRAQLKDVNEKAPWARCIRMAWPQKEQPVHPDDERRWRVSHSFTEFLTLLQGESS